MDRRRFSVRRARARADWGVRIAGYLGALAARRGDRAAALRWDDSLAAVAGPYLYGGPAYARAGIAALLGDRDRAVALLTQSRRDGLAYGIGQHTDTDFERVRNCPPFAALLASRE